MTFHYLDGHQITEACAQRWVACGWIRLVQQEHNDEGPQEYDEYHYEAIAQ